MAKKEKYQVRKIQGNGHMHKNKTWYEKLTGRVIPAKGKSSSSLHAKFFDIDGKVFIGSFNLN